MKNSSNKKVTILRKLNGLFFGASLFALSAGQVHADDSLEMVAGSMPMMATEQASAFGVSAASYELDYSKTQINAYAAYQNGITGAGQIIGVLDSGVARNNPDLTKVAGGWDALTGSFGVTNDNTGHGTFVTGLINGNGIGVEGTAFNAETYPVQVINPAGQLAVNDFQLALGNAVAWYFGGAKIINNSWDSATTITQSTAQSVQAYYPISLNFYHMLVGQGLAFVFAAGNNSQTQVGLFAGLPALFTSLQAGWVAVVATDSTGHLASYSNQCGVAAAWCIAAPGSNLISTLGSGFGIGSGTSFAAPQVSSAIALLQQRFPYLTAGQAAQIILQTANKTGIYANQQLYGQGLLDINAAMNPVGTITIPAANTTSGAQVSVTGSGAIGSASFAQSWSASVGKLMVLDSYNRSYEVNASALVSSPSHTLDSRTAVQQYGFGEGDQIAPGVTGFFNHQFDAQAMGLVSVTTKAGNEFAASTGIDPAYGFGSFESGVVPAGSLITADGVGNPFLNLADQASTAHVSLPVTTGFGDMKVSASVFNGYARTADLTARLTDPSYVPPTVSGGALEVAAPVDAISSRIAVNFGGVREEGRLLGGSTSGAFGTTANTTTAFTGMNIETELAEGLHLIGGMEFGQSNATQTANALNVSYGTLSSESFHAGLVQDGIFGKTDKAGFVVSQPLRVSGGNVSLDVPTSRDLLGDIQTSQTTASAADNGHEMDLQGFYSIKEASGIKFDAGVLLRMQPDNVRTAPAEAIGLMRMSAKF
jgi:hypothetical protein